MPVLKPYPSFTGLTEGYPFGLLTQVADSAEWELSGGGKPSVTLKTSQDLNQFKDGDNVVQSGNGYTPITSVINDVNPNTVASRIDIIQNPGNDLNNTPVFRNCIDKGDTTTSWSTFGTVGFESSTGGVGNIGYWFSDDLVTWFRNSSTNWGPAQPLVLSGGEVYRYQATSNSGQPDNNVVGEATFTDNRLQFVNIEESFIYTFEDSRDIENFREGDVLGGFDNPTGSFPQGDVFYRLSPGYTDYNEFTDNDFELKEGIAVGKQTTRGSDYGTRQYQVDLDSELNTDGLNEMFVECWFYKPTPVGTFAFRGNVSPFNFYGAGGIASTVVGGYISGGTFFPWFKGNGGTVHQRGPISTGTAFSDIGEGWYHLAWYFDADGNNGIYLNGTRVGGELAIGVAPNHSTRPVKGWSNTYTSNAGYCPDSNLACIRFSQGNPYGKTYDQPFTPLPLDSDEWTTQSSVVKMFLPLAGGDQTTVTGVGPGNTLTLNKNSYSVGDVVVGSKIAPATGVVSGQPADNKMNFATTEGRWITNGGLHVIGPAGPATYVDSYLTWDNDNIVTGMVSADPGFAPVDNLVLTFPTNAPTGESWDAELPAGTFMQTRVQASNTEGTVDSGYSAMYTPRTASPVDYNSDLEYAEVALRLKTFTNRKHVYCAQQVEAQRDEAIQALAAEGYELSDILKYL